MAKRALVLSGGGARGAFQIGVWQYLQEIGWMPDLICGTSVGAINAAGIGAQMPVAHLIRIWRTHYRGRMYRLRLIPFLAAALYGRSPRPIMDTRPMRRMLQRHLDLARLRQSPMDIVITAVNVLTARLHLFDQHQITIDHLMASAAMPLLFPYQYIDGEPYWDGGIMANTPIRPALARGADEIVVVLLSPVGHVKQGMPTNLLRAGERLLEHSLIGSYQAGLPVGSAPAPQIITVAPSRMLGFRSMIRFSVAQAHRLIDQGYRAARGQCRPFFE